MIGAVLKIIGIVLACAAAFIVLILLLVLFVPFSWKINASGHSHRGTPKQETETLAQEISAAAKVKWLFGFLNAGVFLESGAVSYRVRVLFIPVFRGNLWKKDEEENEDNAKTSENKRAAKINRNKKKSARVQAKMQPAKKGKKEKAAQNFEKKEKDKKSEPAEKEQNTRGRVFKKKLIKITEKIRKIREKAKKVKYVWDAPVTKRAVRFLKLRIIDLLNHIKPRAVRGHVVFSAGSCDTTAQVYALASIILALTGAELVLEPDFEGNGISIENLNITGRIFAGYVLLLGLKILKNKDVRRVVKYIRRNF